MACRDMENPLEMAEQGQPLLQPIPTPPDQGDLREVVVDQQVIVEDGTKETTPVPVAHAPPLLLACKEGRAAEVKELLEATDPALSREEINMVDEEGETALTWAIISKMPDVALHLMKRGANGDVITNYMLTPLSLACNHGLSELAEELLKGSEERGPGLSQEHINIVNNGETSLTKAIYGKMPDVALHLMKRGAKCDVITHMKCTPLSLACNQGLTEVAEELLKSSEEGGPGLSLEHINTVDDHGETALTGTISTHMLGVMKKLIDRGAGCGSSCTPLHDACRFSFKEGALELMAQEKYKDINTPGPDGKMPLEWAVMNNLSAVVVELLKHGVSIQNNENELIEIKQEDFQAYLDAIMTIDKPEETWKTKSEEKLVMNYRFLSREGEDQTPVLSSVLNLSTEHKELVKHPLVRAFLMMKWRKMVRIWMIWIFLKLIFFGHLIYFAVVIQSSNGQEDKVNETCKTTTNLFKMDTEQSVLMSGQATFTVVIETCDAMTSPLELDTEQFNDEGVNETCGTITSPLRIDGENYLLMTGQVFFTVLLAFFWLIEALQMLTSIKAWLRERKNWLQTAILSGSTYMCIAMFSGSGHCETKHVLATLLPMAYYEGLYEVGYHYKAAKYINLFNRVLKTFINYFVAYVGMIICFAGGYAVMLPAPQDPDNYPDTFWGLLPKVFVMVTGEEEFMNIPFTDHTAFKAWEVLYFLVFLMFTVVVLLNLLNGLAVADAKEMLEASETDSLCSLLGTAAFWDNKLMKEKKYGHNKSNDKNLEDESKNGEGGKEREGKGKLKLARTKFRKQKKVGQNKSNEKKWEDDRNGKGREERKGKEGCNLTAKLRNWWHEDEGNVLNLVIPLSIKERMKWFFVLKSDRPKYFFSVYEGENKTYKAYKDRNCEIFNENNENDVAFTINQELKQMALQIIHTRNLAEEDEKEKERERREREHEKKERENEKKERENQKKERENEKRERKKILDTLELMQRNQNCRVSEWSN